MTDTKYVQATFAFENRPDTTIVFEREGLTNQEWLREISGTEENPVVELWGWQASFYGTPRRKALIVSVDFVIMAEISDRPDLDDWHAEDTTTV